MKTLKEKITLTLTALAYLVFHIRTGPSSGSIMAGTIDQLLTTAPYCIGFTWVLVAVVRYMHDGIWPPWDRIARIFFTIGILFAFYFALYEYGERGYEEQKKLEEEKTSVSLSWPNENRTEPLYWA